MRFQMGGIDPAEPIEIAEDKLTCYTPIIDASLAVGLRDVRLKPRHLRVRQ